VSYVLAAICLLNLVFSRSGTNIVFFVVCIILFYFILRERLSTYKLIKNLTLVFVIGGLSYFLVDITLSLLGKDTTFSGRTEIWNFALRYIGERPLLGYGFGSSVLYLQDMMKKQVFEAAVDAHNGYLQMALDVGVTGLLAWIGAIVVSFSRGLVTWRDRSYEADAANRALLIFLFAGCGVALTETGPFWINSDLGPITYGSIAAIGTLRSGAKGAAARLRPFEVFKNAK